MFFKRFFNTRITAWKLSVFGVILVRISPHSDRITPNTDIFCAVDLLIDICKNYERRWQNAGCFSNVDFKKNLIFYISDQFQLLFFFWFCDQLFLNLNYSGTETIFFMWFPMLGVSFLLYSKCYLQKYLTFSIKKQVFFDYC